MDLSPDLGSMSINRQRMAFTLELLLNVMRSRSPLLPSARYKHTFPDEGHSWKHSWIMKNPFLPLGDHMGASPPMTLYTRGGSNIYSYL